MIYSIGVSQQSFKELMKKKIPTPYIRYKNVLLLKFLFDTRMEWTILLERNKKTKKDIRKMMFSKKINITVETFSSINH